MSSLFFRVKLAGLAQNFVGNRHLAHVVQECAARNDLDFLGRNAHGARQRDGVSGYALGVAFGLGILQVEGIAQRLKSHVVGVLQILHGVAQHLGAGAHHFFETLMVAFGLLEGAAMAERPVHGAEQLLALEGLEQIVVSAAAHGVDGHGDVVDRGDHDDGKIGKESVNAIEQGDAVDILHHDVGEHQIEVVELESLNGLIGSAGHLDGKSLALQRGGNHGAHRGLIVDDKNAHELARALSSAECGRRVRPLRFRQSRSQTPGSVLLAHRSPLICLLRCRQLRPAAMTCSVPECWPCCNR